MGYPFAGLISTIAFAVLWVCLEITKDTRKRRAVWQSTRTLSRDALEKHFGICMWVAGLYLAKPFHPVVSWRRAENALLIATVLREHLEYQSGRKSYVGYLRSRRELAAEAKRYATLHWGAVQSAAR